MGARNKSAKSRGFGSDAVPASVSTTLRFRLLITTTRSPTCPSNPTDSLELVVVRVIRQDGSQKPRLQANKHTRSTSGLVKFALLAGLPLGGRRQLTVETLSALEASQYSLSGPRVQYQGWNPLASTVVPAMSPPAGSSRCGGAPVKPLVDPTVVAAEIQVQEPQYQLSGTYLRISCPGPTIRNPTLGAGLVPGLAM